MKNAPVFDGLAAEDHIIEPVAPTNGSGPGHENGLDQGDGEDYMTEEADVEVEIPGVDVWISSQYVLLL